MDDVVLGVRSSQLAQATATLCKACDTSDGAVFLFDCLSDFTAAPHRYQSGDGGTGPRRFFTRLAKLLYEVR